MKLKTKLKIAFFIMAAVNFIIRRELSQIRNTYGADFRLSDMYSSGALLGKITDETFEEVKDVAGASPEKFTDRAYLSELSDKVTSKLSYLVVRKDGDIYYNSSEYTETELDEMLPGEEAVRNLEGGAVYEGGSYQTILKCDTFRDYSSQTDASAV